MSCVAQSVPFLSSTLHLITSFTLVFLCQTCQKKTKQDVICQFPEFVNFDPFIGVILNQASLRAQLKNLKPTEGANCKISPLRSTKWKAGSRGERQRPCGARGRRPARVGFANRCHFRYKGYSDGFLHRRSGGTVTELRTNMFNRITSRSTPRRKERTEDSLFGKRTR